ncbi:MAG: histidine phosphatase family protein [Alphaproteobacteria bacterium]|nr:histidine phosphatase family protein [Alphaproteobacteria bacterium]
MSKLILVRHAQPVIDASAPSERWVLAPEARDATRALSDALAPYAPQIVLAGTEPKMEGTAAMIAERFGIATERLPGLAEHQRRTGKFVNDTAAFEATIQSLFERPGELVFGEETADQTYARFARTLDAELEKRAGTVVAVSGGTAICLFLSRRSGVDAFMTWKTLRLPMAFALDRSTFAIKRTL